MTTTLTAANGTDGVNGANGADATAIDMPAGDGGDGTAGTDGQNTSHTITQTEADASAGEFRLIGGSGGHGGGGNFTGQSFLDRDESRIGTVETWHETYSPAGNGGSGADGGDGGDSALTGSGLVVAGGFKLVATAGNGGWGGTGFQGTAGSSDFHEFLSDWRTEGGVTISLDWTVDPHNGGIAGIGADAGNGGDASAGLSDSTVHGDVAIEAHGGFSNLAGAGGWGTGGGDQANPGGDGGNGGNGGDATVMVDNDAFDFNQTARFTAQSGSAMPGGMGGPGGYGLTIRDTDHVETIDYVYGTGGAGGDGGDAGHASIAITDTHFTGTAADERLDLQINLTTGERGQGGQGGIGGPDDSTVFHGAHGAAGASGSAALWFDGNVIDGGDGIDDLHLQIFNQTWERSDDGTGLTDLGNVTVDLDQGKILIGSGVSTIQNVENVDFYYLNAYYNAGNEIHYSGHVTVVGDGEDNIIGGTFGDDSLSGGGGADHLNAGGGNDTLDGGAGADVLSGIDGDDTYTVDNSGDVVVEIAGQGHDTVYASASVDMRGISVEDIRLTGSGDIDATGNSLNNSLTGNDGANVLNGGYGNDTIDGGAGADTLTGGSGDDMLVVDNAGDVVVEGNGGGNDTIWSSVSYGLAGIFVETLRLTGTADINATGNSKANSLIGNDGGNTLNGGYGSDILTGGLGSDSFVFNTASGMDTVSDFSAAEGDTINVHAYLARTTAVISQAGDDTTIDLGGGNIITVLNTMATDAAFLAQIVW